KKKIIKNIKKKKIKHRIIMRILINIIETISDHKIKIKNENNETLIRTFSKIHKIFNDKNHMILSHFSDRIQIDQNSVFSSANTIITKKTIFILNVIFQIIQLETVNSLLTLIEHL